MTMLFACCGLRRMRRRGTFGGQIAGGSRRRPRDQGGGDDPKSLWEVVRAAARLPETERTIIANEALTRISDQSDRQEILDL